MFMSRADSKLILRRIRRRIPGILKMETWNQIEFAKMPANQLLDLIWLLFRKILFYVVS